MSTDDAKTVVLQEGHRTASRFPTWAIITLVCLNIVIGIGTLASVILLSPSGTTTEGIATALKRIEGRQSKDREESKAELAAVKERLLLFTSIVESPAEVDQHANAARAPIVSSQPAAVAKPLDCSSITKGSPENVAECVDTLVNGKKLSKAAPAS